VSELAGEPIVSAHHCTIGHNSPTDPRAERDENHVVDTLGGAELPLRNRCARPIVVDLHIASEALGDEAADLKIGNTIKIRSSSQYSPTSYESGDPNTETASGTCGIAERLGQTDEDIEQRREAVRATGSLALLLGDDLAVGSDSYA
jgi:hypothetical protein